MQSNNGVLVPISVQGNIVSIHNIRRDAEGIIVRFDDQMTAEGHEELMSSIQLLIEHSNLNKAIKVIFVPANFNIYSVSNLRIMRERVLKQFDEAIKLQEEGNL